ncbi:ABC transporter substrate-binding protein [Sedimentibacter sp.]|uniref:ABC transporter substrate-binding protein n=1 Tax=Sedimentibacter sp. TaxID=1960295 RepID=UPI0028977DB2|nr:ABC transporter substrate-binding protein [Sedimentibacter sp.]
MKKIKNMIVYICIICFSLVLLSSCKDSESNVTKENVPQAAMGRYVEKYIEELSSEDGGMVAYTAVRNDGTIEFYKYYSEERLTKVYSTADGINFEKKDAAAWYTKILDMGNYHITKIDYDGEGNIYVLIYEGDDIDNGIYNKIFKVTHGNEIHEIDMEWRETDVEDLKVYITDMTVTAEGELMINQSLRGILHYTDEGKYLGQYGSSSDGIYTVSDDYIYNFDARQLKINVYNIETHEMTREIPLDEMTGEIPLGEMILSLKLSSGKDGSIYITDRSGVYKIVKDGVILEKIIDGELTSLGIPSLHFSAILEGINGEFYIPYSDREQNTSVAKYEFDENMPTLPSMELTVYTLNENNTLRQTAGELQNKYPDFKVNIKVGLEVGTSVTKTDAIKQLNGELLGGKGPDLILLDGLSVESYIQKGVLADLSDIVNAYMKDDKLLSSVINTYANDGKYPVIPTKFHMPVIWIDEEYKDYMKNLDTFIEFVQEKNDKPVFGYFEPADLITTFSYTCFPEWINEGKEINRQELTKFLQNIKVLYDNRGDFTGSDGKAFAWAFNKTYGCYSLLKGYQSYVIENLAQDKRQGGIPLFLPGQVEKSFVPVNCIGVNNNSANIDIAKEFVSLMLSEAVQKAPINDGFPVNLDALEYGALGTGNEGMYYMISGPGEETLEGVPPSREKLEVIKELCYKVKNPSVPDEVLIEIIIENSKEYFEGEITVEDAVEKIKEKSKLYLSE